MFPHTPPPRPPFLPALLLAALLLLAPRPARAELLSVRVDGRGVLNALSVDRRARDAKQGRAGETLVCLWRLPEIEKVEWPLKQRGIVYKQAYRRCWGAGEALEAAPPRFAGRDGVVFSTAGQGVWLMSRRGRFRRLPGFGTEEGAPEAAGPESGEGLREPAEAARGKAAPLHLELAARPEWPDLFLLSARRNPSVFSAILDRWRSELWWIPDLAEPETSSLIMSRSSDRVEMPLLFSPADQRLAEALRAMDLDSLAPLIPEEETETAGGPPQESGAGPGEGGEEAPPAPPADWLWYRTKQAVGTLLAFLEPPGTEDRPVIYFLQNGRRIGRLVPGAPEMSLFPELDPFVFRDGLKGFRVLDERTAVVLSVRGLYRIDMPTGHHELVAALPAGRIRHLYGDLALSPDHRYAAFRAWTSAHREEIFIADLEGASLRAVVRGEMDLRFRPDAAAPDRIARFNPGPFNFSPDGMALVTLWRVLDGQEMRVYRIVEGRPAEVPLKPEEPEEEPGAPAAEGAGPPEPDR